MTASTGSRAVLATTLVAGAACAWVALVVVSLGGTWAWPAAALTVSFCLLWLGARTQIGDIAEKRQERVDEYEQVQRDRARSVGYTVTLLLGAVVFVVLTVATNLADGGDDDLLRAAPGLVFCVLLAGASLPTFLLTWQLRHRAEDPYDDPADLPAPD